MAFSRYSGTEIILNDLEEHKEFFEVRGKKFIKQHRTRPLKDLSVSAIAALHHHTHLWKQADRYWKLADKYYGDTRYLWVIAQYNQKPTEAHIAVGDIIIVPAPLQQVLTAMGY